MKTRTIWLAIGLGTLGTALPASAADIRDQLTPDLIYKHCQTAGVGSQTDGAFMLPSGRVTGSVLCTQADLASSNMPVQVGVDDDDDEDHRGRHRNEGHDDDDD